MNSLASIHLHLRPHQQVIEILQNVFCTDCLLLYFQSYSSCFCTVFLHLTPGSNTHTHTGWFYSSFGQTRSSSRSHDSLIDIQTHYRVDDLMTPGHAGDTESVHSCLYVREQIKEEPYFTCYALTCFHFPVYNNKMIKVLP